MKNLELWFLHVGISLGDRGAMNKMTILQQLPHFRRLRSNLLEFTLCTKVPFTAPLTKSSLSLNSNWGLAVSRTAPSRGDEDHGIATSPRDSQRLSIWVRLSE
jgi:hypothetical protein